MAKSKLEYLQKYLGGSKEEKKEKKKAVKNVIKKGKGLKIIDDDYDFRKIGNEETEDNLAFMTQEEQPQIAGYVDERPKEAILKEKFSDSSRWKTVGRSPQHTPDSDARGKRRHDSESDESPVRRPRNDESPVRRRNESDSDVSPPRRKRADSDLSPTHAADSDQSPVRGRKEPQSDSDQSPVRVKKEPESDSDQSPVRTKERNVSPARRMIERNLDTKRKVTPAVVEGKMERTLDGRKAGLQSKEALREENAAMKRREAEMFERAGSEITGKGAKVVARAEKQRQLDEKEKKKKEKEEKLKELETKYKFWSKGVKQQAQFSARVEEMAHEMAKPLTRHAGDEDLERHLKEQIYEEDPMAAYVQKKKQKGKPDRPKYTGPLPPPNRYGILPGYRWDGVDRSNGFEKEWFESQNSRKALEEEAYKWRSEDM